MAYLCVMPEQPYTVAQAAQILGVDRRTIVRRIQRGELRATKHGGGRTSAYLVDQRQVTRLARTL